MKKNMNTLGFRDLKSDFAAFHSVWSWNKHVPVDQLHHSGCYTWTPGHALGLCLSGRSWRRRPWPQVSWPWPLTFFEINHETTPEVVTHLNKEIQRNLNLCYSLFNIYISWVFLWLLLKSLSLFYGLVNIKSHLVRNYLLTCEGNYSCNTISPN